MITDSLQEKLNTDRSQKYEHLEKRKKVFTQGGVHFLEFLDILSSIIQENNRNFVNVGYIFQKFN